MKKAITQFGTKMGVRIRRLLLPLLSVALLLGIMSSCGSTRGYASLDSGYGYGGTVYYNSPAPGHPDRYNKPPKPPKKQKKHKKHKKSKPPKHDKHHRH